MIDADISHEDAESTVVLLHSLALDRTIWGDFAARLGADRCVIVPDLPGHGADPQGDPTSVETMADGVAELLRANGRSGVTLIGMSLGGSVAQALTIRHPDLVDALGLIDTTGWYGPDAPTAWAQRANQAKDQGIASLAGFQLDRWFTPAFREAHPQTGQRLLEIFGRNDLSSYVASCTALGAMDLRSRLPEISVPVAIVVGELDQATPPDHAYAIASLVPQATVTVLPDCKHLSAIERPDDVIAALAGVL